MMDWSRTEIGWLVVFCISWGFGCGFAAALLVAAR